MAFTVHPEKVNLLHNAKLPTQKCESRRQWLEAHFCCFFWSDLYDGLISLVMMLKFKICDIACLKAMHPLVRSSQSQAQKKEEGWS